MHKKYNFGKSTAQKVLLLMNSIKNIKTCTEPSENNLSSLINYYKKEDFNSVLTLGNELIKVFPQSITLLNFIAICCSKLNDLSGALSNYKAIVKINPHEVDGYFNLANIYKDMDEVDLAISSYQQVLQLNPADADAFNNLGVCFDKKGESKKAFESYQQAIIYNPFCSEAYNNVGAYFDKLGDFDKAIEKYRKAVEINPDYVEAINNMGLASQRNDEFDNAIKFYKHALQLNPNYSDAYVNLGDYWTEQNKFDFARENYEQALTVDPNNYNVHNAIGNLNTRIGDLSSAMNSFTKALSIAPREPEIYFNIGIVHNLSKDSSTAIKWFKKAIKIKPTFINAHHMIGVVYQGRGEMDKALESYKAALRFDPDNYRSSVHFVQAGHLLAALTGKTTDSAPQGYIENLFNKYAHSFDHSLLEELDYCGPQAISKTIKSIYPKCYFKRILDLGCGTGLVGAELYPFCDELEGIDLSKSMLAEAEAKGLYDRLTKSDIKKYLSTAELDFDLFIACDVFIYVGELTDIFRLIKSRNKGSGRIAFTTEHTEKDGYFLEKSARFSHSKQYIERLCTQFDYDIIESSLFKIRKDGQNILTGGLYLLEF